MFEVLTPEQVHEDLEELKAQALDALQFWTQPKRVPSSGRDKVRHLKDNIVPLIRLLSSEAERQAVVKEVAANMDGVNKDIVLQALREVEAHHLVDDDEDEAPQIPEEEWLPLLTPGVADRYVADVCAMQSVVGEKDRKVVKAGLYSLVGSQLSTLPTGKPTGSSIMLTGPSGRGKNYLLDASVYAAPTSWYRAFTVASSQAFYWAAELDPAFLNHRFIYPNEKEAVDQVIEFLRPMLSQGSAEKYVTDRNDAGKLTFRRISVEGPITGAVPTIRNVLDDQLQNRLLIIELVEYKGRNEAQTRALSKQYTLERLVAPDKHKVDTWRAALTSLTGARHVVIPYAGRDEFCLASDDVESGPRLWANLLGLLCANAFLEQRNRRTTDHDGRKVVHANAEDYQTAYELIRDLAGRSLEPLGETHKKIVQAVYDLRQEADFPEDGFSVTKIADKARVSKGTVSKNRAYLTRSVGMLYETESGKLNIPAEATPAWWEGGNVMEGFPAPAMVKAWEEGTDPPMPPPSDTEKPGNTETFAEEPHRNGKKPVSSEWKPSGNVSTKSCRHPQSARVLGNNAEEFCADCGENMDALRRGKELTQQQVYEAFLSFGDRVNNGGVLRSEWKRTATKLGISGRDFATAQRRLEKVGRVVGKEYSQQNDQYFYRRPKLGEDQ